MQQSPLSPQGWAAVEQLRVRTRSLGRERQTIQRRWQLAITGGPTPTRGTHHWLNGTVSVSSGKLTTWEVPAALVALA